MLASERGREGGSEYIEGSNYRFRRNALGLRERGKEREREKREVQTPAATFYLAPISTVEIDKRVPRSGFVLSVRCTLRMDYASQGRMDGSLDTMKGERKEKERERRKKKSLSRFRKEGEPCFFFPVVW